MTPARTEVLRILVGRAGAGLSLTSLCRRAGLTARQGLAHVAGLVASGHALTRGMGAERYVWAVGPWTRWRPEDERFETQGEGRGRRKSAKRLP